MAADFGGFYASRRPEPCPAGWALLLTCDGSAFPVLSAALRPATAKAAAARAKASQEEGWPDDPADLRKSRKRTAGLAAVADIPPAPRTPPDIVRALFGPPRPGTDGPKPEPGPKAQGKTLFASVIRPADVIADAFAEAHRRDRGHERPWIAVIGGNCHQIETVHKLAAQYKILPRRARGQGLGPRADSEDPGREAPRRPCRDPAPCHRVRVQRRRAGRRR